MSAYTGTQTMVEEQPSPYDNKQASSSSDDFQEYLQRSTHENGASQSPRRNSLTSLNSLTRAESIFSYSKSSFSSQLSGLTSMTLPQAESLAASVAALPSAPKAVKALTTSSAEIQRWTEKAIKVLSNLDAEDDVEWAAAAGRDALDDVDKAVDKFETLIEVYVQAIEELQLRSDVADVNSQDLNAVVEQMETTLRDWDKVRKLLKDLHEQVELATEWEDIWNDLLGEVGKELENLDQLVFEMEERRHKAMRADAESKVENKLDIDELETIVEESPAAKTAATLRFSLPAFAPSPASPAPNPQDDGNLLALFARMQPLRASLDFLPMRLSMFRARAETIFPSACAELEEKRDRLEASWTQLEKEAETLRRELGEDRWILVFRNAGRQAQKMMESVERSVAKLQDAIDTDTHHGNPPSFAQKVESFEAKRMHYGPAIDRVLSIIQKGVKDRLTVNGEILRLHLDLTARSEALHETMEAMQGTLEEMNTERNSQIRDSISTLISMDRSVSSSMMDTPGSSPASSIVLASKDSGSYINGSKSRASSRSRQPMAHRLSSLPQPPHQQPRRQSSGLLSSPSTRLGSPSPSRSSATPTPGKRNNPPPPSLNNRPRWNSSSNTNDLLVGHNFKPLSATTPSPYRKVAPPPRSASRTSSIPLRSPLSRETSSSPVLPSQSSTTNGYGARPPSRTARPPSRTTRPPSRTARPPSRTTGSNGTSFAERVAAASGRPTLYDPAPYGKMSRNVSAPTASSFTRSASKPLPALPSTPQTNRTQPTYRPPSSLRSASSLALPYRSIRAETPPLPRSRTPIMDDMPSSPPLPPSSPPLEIDSSPLQQASKPSRLAKRASMLPLPSSGMHVRPGPKTPSGRQSSMGNRPAWR